MKKLLITAIGIITIASMGGVVFAKIESKTVGGTTYYKVTSEDPNLDTGTEVCAAAGKTCVGYTRRDTKVCETFHPDAAVQSGVDGSKSGFYCDGAPQGGVCAKEENTCRVCPNCNVNLTCDTAIGDQYREAYVECKGADVPKISFFNRIRDLMSDLTKRFGGWFSSLAKLRVKTVQVIVPGGNFDDRIGIHPGTVACEFYQVTKPGDPVQSNKKLVTCGAIKAADTFCVNAMQSRFAKAVKCEDNGIIVCTNPCNPPEYQLPLKQCAFDNDRPRGNQAAPISFCDSSETEIPISKVPPAGTKTPGQECKHGGECTTGNCLGQPSDQGIKYFCSCDPFKLDFSSCKP